MLPVYHRKAQYYETDQMGIVHHSTYIRWMEEARIEAMEQLGYPMMRLEQEGIQVPVVEVQCRYLTPVTLGQIVTIELKVSQYTGVRLCFQYRMLSPEGQLCVEGRSTHCFWDSNHRLISLKRKNSLLHELLSNLLPKKN